MSQQTSELVKIGELKKPYGVQGWLWLFSYTDDRENVFDIQPWIIKTAIGQKTLTVKNWRSQGKGYVVQLNEVTDRNTAETMFGVTLWADKSRLLSTLSEDEYYWADLVGLTVIGKTETSGEQTVNFGRIKELFETGAHAIMVVEPTADSIDNEERLIPWHKQTVIAVDLANKTMTVDWGVDY